MHVASLAGWERDAKQEALAARVLDHVSAGACVALYRAIGSEIDPRRLIDQLHARGHRLALPHIETTGTPMRFLRWAPGDTLVPGPMGLQQPRSDAVEMRPEIVMAPLLGFDAHLNRLGYGGGFYDRALAILPHARAIGLAWALQRVESIPTDIWDKPLAAVATEQEWLEQ